MATAIGFVVLGAALAFIMWGSFVSIRRRFRLVQPSAGPDYESFASFYRSNPLRRGDDIPITELDDQGYRWEVSWLPKTQEVVALSAGWADERAHLYPGGAFGTALLSPIPQLVHVLGSATTSQDARQRLAGRLGIDDCRSALSS